MDDLIDDVNDRNKDKVKPDKYFKNNYSCTGCIIQIIILLAILYFTFDYWNPIPKWN